MRDITIDDEVFKLLQDEAEALVDDANSVLRRLLGIDPERTTTPPPRAETGDIMPLGEYRGPLIDTLAGADSSGMRRKDILISVYPRIRHLLKPLDKEEYPSGGIRWENRATSELMAMAKKGLVNRTGYGTWRLTKQGLDQFERQRVSNLVHPPPGIQTAPASTPSTNFPRPPVTHSPAVTANDRGARHGTGGSTTSANPFMAGTARRG